MVAVFSFIAVGFLVSSEKAIAAAAVKADPLYYNSDDSVLILPNSPLYFFKRVSRSIQRTIVRDPLTKADLELQIMNERAVELLRLSMTSGNKWNNDLSDAAIGYESSIRRVSGALAQVSDKSADNPMLDKLLDGITSSAIRNIGMFSFMEDNGDKQTIELAEKTADSTISLIASFPKKYDIPNRFGNRIKSAIEKEKNMPDADNIILDFLASLDKKITNDEVKRIMAGMESSYLQNNEVEMILDKPVDNNMIGAGN